MQFQMSKWIQHLETKIQEVKMPESMEKDKIQISLKPISSLHMFRLDFKVAPAYQQATQVKQRSQCRLIIKDNNINPKSKTSSNQTSKTVVQLFPKTIWRTHQLTFATRKVKDLSAQGIQSNQRKQNMQSQRIQK